MESRMLELNRKHMIEEFLAREPFLVGDLTSGEAELFDTALTHPTWAKEREDRTGKGEDDYERLEFLGDAVIELAVRDILYDSGELSEGSMTDRKKVLSNASLARVIKGRGIPLGDMILLGRGLDNEKGRGNQSVLANSFEALMAAMFRTRGLGKVRDVCRELFIDEMEAFNSEGTVNRLQNLVQARGEETPAYDHELEGEWWVAATVIGGRRYTGMGKSKKEATREAARMAYEDLS